MQGINKVIIIGTLGKDPEVKKVGDNSVANFSVATSERYTDRNGVKQEKTEWHNMVAWGKLADLIGRTLKKGKAAYFEGKLTTRSWDDQQGNKRYATEVLVREMSFISRSETAQSPQQQNSQQPQQQNFQQPQPIPQYQQPQQEYHQQPPQAGQPIQPQQQTDDNLPF